MQYALYGGKKTEFWWVHDDVVAEICGQLKARHFCVLDGFLGQERVLQLRQEVMEAHRMGRLTEKGALAGGRTGANLTYTKENLRGDLLGWFDGDEGEGWTHLPQYLLKVGTLISELKDHIPELRTTSNRSRAMVTCYPAGGTRYIRHVDNGNQNGRKLTAILYLNNNWAPGDGGELRVFGPGDSDEVVADVAPVCDRLLLFWSDARVPHEVLPCYIERYAITVWMFDSVERQKAVEAEKDREAVKKEAERIQREMTKFRVNSEPSARPTNPISRNEEPSPPADKQDVGTDEEGLLATTVGETVERTRPQSSSSATDAFPSPAGEQGSAPRSLGTESFAHDCAHSLCCDLLGLSLTGDEVQMESWSTAVGGVVAVIRTPSSIAPAMLKEAALDVNARRLCLSVPTSTSDSPLMQLSVDLPIDIDPENVRAKYSKREGVLRVKMPAISSSQE